MAVPRSGRSSLRPTANFSRPRDSSHRLPLGIEALDTVYHTGGGRIGGTAKREEVAPTDSQFLQAQGHLTSFAIRHRGPGQVYNKKPAVGHLLTAGLVGMAGIEPARAESKSAVLPLDYTPV